MSSKPEGVEKKNSTLQNPQGYSIASARFRFIFYLLSATHIFHSTALRLCVIRKIEETIRNQSRKETTMLVNDTIRSPRRSKDLNLQFNSGSFVRIAVESINVQGLLTHRSTLSDAAIKQHLGINTKVHEHDRFPCNSFSPQMGGLGWRQQWVHSAL